jgi:hypothetical protein
MAAIMSISLRYCLSRQFAIEVRQSESYQMHALSYSLTTISNKGVHMPDLRYVEGYVLVLGDSLVHHAWVTLDGVHAIDLTLREEPLAYFGVIVPTKQACNLMCSGRRLLPALHALGLHPVPKTPS